MEGERDFWPPKLNMLVCCFGIVCVFDTNIFSLVFYSSGFGLDAENGDPPNGNEVAAYYCLLLKREPPPLPKGAF